MNLAVLAVEEIPANALVETLPMLHQSPEQSSSLQEFLSPSPGRFGDSGMSIFHAIIVQSAGIGLAIEQHAVSPTALDIQANIFPRPSFYWLERNPAIPIVEQLLDRRATEEAAAGARTHSFSSRLGSLLLLTSAFAVIGTWSLAVFGRFIATGIEGPIHPYLQLGLGVFTLGLAGTGCASAVTMLRERVPSRD